MNINIILLTIIEIFYLFYMFRIFKTTLSINHPLEYIYMDNLSNYFKHSISTNIYENKICDFGKDAILILIIYLIIRLFLNLYDMKINRNINYFILVLSLFISFMNLNAVLYILPFILLDILYY